MGILNMGMFNMAHLLDTEHEKCFVIPYNNEAFCSSPKLITVAEFYLELLKILCTILSCFPLDHQNNSA